MARSYRMGARHVAVAPRRLAPGRFSLTVDGVPHEVEAVVVGPSTLWIVVDGAGREVAVVRRGDTFHVGIGGAAYMLVQEAAETAAGNHAAALAPPEIVSPMPGRILQVMVSAGQKVAAGDGLLILEAMKMEHRIAAEAAATVRAVWVAEGQMVDGGTVLVELGYE